MLTKLITELVERDITQVGECDNQTRQKLVAMYKEENADEAEKRFFMAIDHDGEISTLISAYNPHKCSSQFWSNFGYNIDATYISLIEDMIDEGFVEIASTQLEIELAMEFEGRVKDVSGQGV